MVIVFYNEVWFIFFRIVYSIINRLLRELFNEILLVDDVSERGIIEGLVDLRVRIYLFFIGFLVIIFCILFLEIYFYN